MFDSRHPLYAIVREVRLQLAKLEVGFRVPSIAPPPHADAEFREASAIDATDHRAGRRTSACSGPEPMSKRTAEIATLARVGAIPTGLSNARVAQLDGHRPSMPA